MQNKIAKLSTHRHTKRDFEHGWLGGLQKLIRDRSSIRQLLVERAGHKFKTCAKLGPHIEIKTFTTRKVVWASASNTKTYQVQMTKKDYN